MFPLTALSRADDAMTDVIFNTGSILFPIGQCASTPQCT